MKKIISVLLVFTMLGSIVNVSFAEEVEQGSVTSYGVSSISDKELNDIELQILIFKSFSGINPSRLRYKTSLHQ